MRVKRTESEQSPTQRSSRGASRQPGRTRSPAGTAILAALLAVTLLAGLSACSFNREEPATVTLPEHGTTTSTTPSAATPDQGAATAEETPPKLAWAVQVGGAGEDVLNAVAGVQTSVVAVGSTSEGIDQAVVGGTDVLSVTVDAAGVLSSTEQFGTTADESAAAVSATAKNSLACGSTTGYLADALGPENGNAFGGQEAGSNGSDAWCAPLPLSGGGRVTQLGGSAQESITGLALPQGASVARGSEQVGFGSGTVDGYFPGAEDPAGRGLGAGDALAFRVGSDGSALWARQFGTAANDAALGVCAVAEDGIFVGYTDGDLEGNSKGLRDAWISRIDAKGVQRWITQFGGAGTDEFRAVAAAGDAREGTEQFVAVGSTDGDIDQSGPLANSGRTDAIITSFASDGTIKWATQLGSEFEDVATAVAADGTNIYVAGTTRNSNSAGVTGEGGAGAATGPDSLIGLGDLNTEIGPGGGTDSFLASLDAKTGQVRWITRMGSAADESTTGLTITDGGLLVLSGITAGQVASTPPAGRTDGFLLAFQLPTSGGAAASSV